jgi:2-keto-4-pentenoate hydratase
MLSDRGLRLAKGAVVLAGAATEAVALESGAIVEAEVEELGRASVTAR